MTLVGIKEKMFLHYLQWRTRPSYFLNYLRKKPIKEINNLSSIDATKIKVGSCQLKLKLMKTPLEYVEDMYRYTDRAAKEGVQLLVFPENNSFQLLGLLPGVEAMAKNMDTNNGKQETVSIADLLRFVSPVFNKVAQETFSFLARSYGIYIMAGSFPYAEGPNLLNRAFLYGPKGNMIGIQDKVHLMPIEHEWGLTQGKKFQVFSTLVGNVSMPVCMDATYFETFRILAYLGAEIITVPIANPEPYNFWLALRGIWPRVQESLVYGIKSAMVGDFLGFTFTGKSGIYAPMELTSKRNGILAESKYSNKEDLVTASINLEALRKLRNSHPYLGDKNLAIAQKYFNQIYDSKNF